MKTLKCILAAAVLLSLHGLCFAGATVLAPVQSPSPECKAPKIIVIADGTTDIPGKHGVKFSNLAAAFNSDSNVAFVVIDPVTQNLTGIYLFHGEKIVTVADMDTFVPGSREKFTDLNSPAIGGSNVAFTGKSASVEGIYLYNGKKILTVVDTNTKIPGSGGKFIKPDYPAINNDGKVVFCEVDPVSYNPIGVYLYNGKKIVTIADKSTTVPKTAETFEGVSYPSINGDYVAFPGNSATTNGIYVFNGKKLLAAVDSNTRIPGSQDKFGGFSFYGQEPVAGNVAFIGYGAASEGVYLYRNEVRKVVKVADTNTTIPGSRAKFIDFDSPLASGDYVVFTAKDKSYDTTGIYFFDGRRLKIVADTKTNIPGTSIKFSQMSLAQISGENVAFFTVDAHFNVTGIYLFRSRNSYEGRDLFTVADLNTIVPGSRDKYTVLSFPSIDDTRVVFTGGAVGMDGVYLYTQQY